MAKRLSKFKLNPHIILYLIGALVVLALTVQALFIRDLYDRSDRQAADGMEDLLIDAVHGLNREPAVEPTTGRLFIPASHLVLPPNPSLNLYYRAGADESTVHFVDASNQAQAISKMRGAQSLTDVFKEVSTLQICSRQIVVSFAPDPKDSDDLLTLKNTKKLKDGRTVYVYQNQCPHSAETMVKHLENIESF